MIPLFLRFLLDLLVVLAYLCIAFPIAVLICLPIYRLAEGNWGVRVVEDPTTDEEERP